jgi:hypothetical protein
LFHHIETEKTMRTFFASAALFCLPVMTSTAIAAEPSVVTPAVFEFGSSVAHMNASLQSACETLDVRELDVADMPIAQNSHTQIDCHGFDHAGQPRLAEFVFADDALAFVWVLTEAEEAPVLRAALEAEFGTPTHDTSMFTAFADNNVSLRHDTPEFLYYGEHIAPMYRGWFDQMAVQ